MSAPLVDGFGRAQRALRLSVTDRCNLRCRYCMPAEGMDWLPGDGLMTRAEIARVVAVLARLGVREVRVTGGEPLLRGDLAEIVHDVRSTPGVGEVSLTTNGVLLADRVDALAEAGLDRVNVSLDSLDPERFTAITRRDDLARVLAGIDACAARPRLRPIKVNVVLLRGLSEPDVLPLAGLARRRDVVVRFIEAMPIDAGREWTAAAVIPGDEVRRMVAARWPLAPMPRERASAPATRWRFADGAGEVQFVSSVSRPFCADCDRLRVTADGRLRTCLFAEEETDLLGPLRAGAEDDELARVVRAAVAGKQAGHGIGTDGWEYAGRPMSRIGG